MSTEERLARLGLLHLDGDPAALEAELERRAAVERARARTWDDALRRWLAAEASANDAETGSPTFAASAVTAAPASLSAPEDRRATLATWDYLCEVALPPFDLAADTRRLFDELWDQVGDAIARLTPTPADGERVSDRAARLRARLNEGGEATTLDQVSMLLALAEAIARGALSR